MWKPSLLFVAALCSWQVSSGALFAAPQPVQHAHVELVADTAAVAPGESFRLGIRFELEPHWHLYWLNPGSSGFPITVDWDLPEGFAVSSLRFPAPQRVELGGLVTYVHKGTPMFVAEVKVPANLPAGSRARFQVAADWLLCKDVCIADAATLRLEVPVEAARIPANQEWFTRAQAAQAQQNPAVRLAAEVAEAHVVLRIDGVPEPAPGEDLYFYSQVEGRVDPDAEQVRLADPFGLQLTRAESFSGAWPVTLAGVLQVGAQAYAVEVQAAAALPAEPSAASAVGFEQRLLRFGFAGWLLLAFLGGLILNVMPCVLPVLSLKVFSLLKHTGQSRAHAFAHGLAYTLGVVLSFVILAGVLFALRSAGEWIGWGYQLQSPGFTLALGVLFFVFALNLLGVFELGVGLVGADAKWAQRHDLQGSFAMGVLAAVVGAPCMGPLVASVSGVALQVPVVQGLLIFATMGLGLASPFLLLAVFPSLLVCLPKPGAWMETFKQIMGFLLLFAVLFIASVMGRAGGAPAIVTLLFTLLLAALAVWIFGRWGAPVQALRTRRIATALTLVLLVAALSYGIPAARNAYRAGAAPIQTEGSWATWSPERVAAELAAGNPVFVDFTASWCLICQANKLALRSTSTDALWDAYGVVTLEADWTQRDPVIAQVLQAHGRVGVPLYLLYAPDGRVIALPQNLSKQTIRAAVEAHLNQN
jgi:thiol:disulfide interchange protein DsbD